LKKNVGGGGVESISPRRKTFKIFNAIFGVVIPQALVSGNFFYLDTIYIYSKLW
jgi:hypothetical protein